MSTRQDIKFESRQQVQPSDLCKKLALEIIRVTNGELVTLFWSIGSVLNSACKTMTAQKRNEIVSTLSEYLSTKYGKYFTVSNLRDMMQFSRETTSSESQVLACLLSWQHIQSLLGINNWPLKISLIKDAIKDDLSPKELKHVVIDSNIDTVAVKEAIKIESELNKILIACVPELVTHEHLFPNVFRGSHGKSFMILLTSSNVNKPKDSFVPKAGLNAIVTLVESFKEAQRRWLNARLIMNFWDIGRKCRESTLSIGKVGKIPANELTKMAQLAELIDDPSVMSQLAYSITWDHLSRLLDIKNADAITQYADEIGSGNLTVGQLSEKIVLDRKQGRRFRKMQPPKKKVTKKTKGGITSTMIEITVRETKVYEQFRPQHLLWLV